MPNSPLFIKSLTTDPTTAKNQHWVAKSYLKLWRDPSTPQGAFLWTMPKDRSSPPRLCSPKTIFVSSDMNTLVKDGVRNLLLENLYQGFETAFGAIRTRLFAGAAITQNEHSAIVNFVSAQLIRTPKFRGRWEQLKLVGDLESELSKISDLALREAARLTLKNLLLNQNQILCLSSLSKVIECIGNMRMVLLKTNDPTGFITSDSPCSLVEYENRSRSFFECLESPTANVVMPLSPNILSIFDHSLESHEMIELYPNQPILGKANSLIWNGADTKIIMRHQMQGKYQFEKVTGFYVQ